MNRLRSFDWDPVGQLGFLLAFLAVGFAVSAAAVPTGEADAWFQEGNRAYQEGRYGEALRAYSRILVSGQESGPLYYNMGNCHYKLGDIGRAVLFFERARRRMPDDEDIRANLAMANLATVDKIEPQPVFLPVRLVTGFIRWIPKSRLVNLVLALQALAVLSFAVFFAARRPLLRALGLRLGIGLTCLTVVFGSALMGQMRESRVRSDAVILAGKVDVMSAPGAEGVEIFSLHAGTRVKTDQQTEDWVEIVLPDRKVGWVKKGVLEWI